MPTIKNITEGPKGLNGPEGPVVLEAGAEIDIELSEAEHRSSYRTGWFDMPEPGESDTDRDALKAQADELGIEYAKNIPTQKLKEQVDAKVAENAAAAAAQ